LRQARIRGPLVDDRSHWGGTTSLLALAGKLQHKIVVTDIPVAPSFQLEAIDAQHRLGCAGPQASQRMVGLLTVKGR